MSGEAGAPGARSIAAMSAVALAGILMLAAAGFVPPAMARWLDTGEDPVPADMAIVLGGGSGERAHTALEVYRAGLVDRIMITDGTGYPDALHAHLEQQGVPRRALIAPPRPARTTWEDALTVRMAVMRHGLRSVLVITSPYHCRRARMALDRALAGLDVDLTVIASVSLYMDPGTWWRTEQGWITLAPEYPKLLWNWIFLPGLETLPRPRGGRTEDAPAGDA